MGIYAFFPWIWIWFNKFFHSTGPIHPFVLGDPISLKCAIDYANGVLFREFSTVPMSLSEFSTLPYMIFRVFSLMKMWRSIWSFHFSRDERHSSICNLPHRAIQIEHLFLKMLSFLQCVFLSPLSKVHISVDVWNYIWIFNCNPLINVSFYISMSIPYYFYY